MNVAVSRARKRMIVVASIVAENISVKADSKPGMRESVCVCVCARARLCVWIVLAAVVGRVACAFQ